MKQFRIIACAIIAGVCTAASAQKVITLDQLKKNQQQKGQTTQATTTRPKTTFSTSDVEDFNTLYFQYNIETMHFSSGGYSGNSTGSAITFGYGHAFGLSDNVPVYVEPGAALQYFFDSENGVKFQMLSLKIPVNLIYTWKVSDNVCIDPYFGLFMRANLMAKDKFDKSWGSPTSSVNLFSKDDMGDDTWNRVQAGLQVGVRVRLYNVCTLGFGFSQDFNTISESTHMHSFDFTLGLNF